MKLIVYSKPNCVQCTATVRALDKAGIGYDYVDLTEDSVSLEKLSAMGYRQAPVVTFGEEIWTGFRPDMISKVASAIQG